MNDEFHMVTRLEVIHEGNCESCHGAGVIHIEGQEGSLECPACHGQGMRGREVIYNNKRTAMELSLQDSGRTLKIFLKKRGSR